MPRTCNEGREGLALIWIPLLHLLVLVLVLRVRGIEGRHMNDDSHETTHMHHAGHASSSHMDHMDPALMIFFTINDLKLGKTMDIYFPKRNPSKSPHLLSKQEADSIPFSSKQLPHLLQLFSFS